MDAFDWVRRISESWPIRFRSARRYIFTSWYIHAVAWVVLLALLGSYHYRQRTETAEDAAARIRYHISLAREGALYLERHAGGLELYASGWKLKQFNLQHQGRLGGRPVNLTSVAQVVPVKSPPRKFISTEPTPEESSPGGSVASPTEVIGVGSMPASFCVRLQDGRIWYVSSAGGFARPAWIRNQWLRLRVGWLLLQAALGDDPLDYWYAELDEGSARELFWLIRNGMRVIH